MKKYEIASKIRYKLGLNDRLEDILIKLSEKDLNQFLDFINDKDNF